MPPRFTYWTIIFGGQATSFRSASRDELLPTFKQIQAKHADAQLRYFARGKLWYSEEEAQASLIRERFERKGHDGRRRFEREHSSRPEGEQQHRPEGERRTRDDSRPAKPGGGKPRSNFGQPDAGSRTPHAGGWKPRSDFRKPDAGSGKPHAGGWKPRSDFRKPDAGSGKPDAGGWKPRSNSRKPEAGSRTPDAGGWKPRSDFRKPDAASGKPEAGGEDRGAPRPPRGRDWRPGGEHKDPRAQFKVPRDIKRARMAKKFGWKKKKKDGE